MSTKNVSPSITETAFSCPHCGAYTTQYWYQLGARMFNEETRIPSFPDPELRSRVLSSNESSVIKKDAIAYLDRIESGLVSAQESSSGNYYAFSIENLHLSKCYNCKKIAVWVYRKLAFPQQKIGVMPNEDLPDDIRRDFEEARDIIALSPRGAAALLRLCVQKLCISLGEKGKKIDNDIASLVSKGLNQKTQQALDVVRVIGNEAVHPGVIDLKDDHDTAICLLGLINVIAESMITQPKTIQQMYDKIPEHKKKAIEERNSKVTNSGS